MATLNEWIAGARPRTLPAAFAPITVGSAAAYASGELVWGYALLSLAVAILLQIGVNYANDYSDGIRGTDEVRVGPVRLVGQRLATPANVKLAAMVCFFFAALLGLALVALSGLWIMIPVGAAAILAAWFYTGGSRPYGYAGFGELFVFVFFGLVATLGTMATMTPITRAGLMGAIGVGVIASAILVANNLRDIPTDREHGKRTLAVRLGDRGTRLLYVTLIVIAYAAVTDTAIRYPWVALTVAGLVVLLPGLKAVLGGAKGKDLIPALATTGLFELVWAILYAAGLVIGSR